MMNNAVVTEPTSFNVYNQIPISMLMLLIITLLLNADTNQCFLMLIQTNADTKLTDTNPAMLMLLIRLDGYDADNDKILMLLEVLQP
jgi:hypothetical protein